MKPAMCGPMPKSGSARNTTSWTGRRGVAIKDQITGLNLSLVIVPPPAAHHLATYLERVAAT
jgi:hypothetical protein